MSELPDSIIDGIKEILGNSKNILKKTERHQFIQNELIKFLQSKDFDTFREYNIQYNGKYRIKKKFGEPKDRKIGMIDVYGKSTGLDLAIEYDNSPSLKWKSIEKLLQSDAKYCFGLSFGPENRAKGNLAIYHLRSLRKLKQVYKELIIQYNENKEYDKIHKLITKNFWLGEAIQGYFEKIKFKDL